MKNYEQLKPESFKRLTGVKPDTFEAMLEVCELYHEKKKAKGGKPNKLSVSTQILLMLEYYREYRSMAHMAFDYEVSESTVSRVIKEIESVLLGSGKFSLPSKKALYKDDGIELQYILNNAYHLV
jgi:transcriptional antiterminator